MLKEKREIKRERKREKILEAAAELFSTKHYHEVMMDDVARLISVAKEPSIIISRRRKSSILQ